MYTLKVPSNSIYLQRTIGELNNYQVGLWDNLDLVPELPLEQGRAILSGFLEQACQCQNIHNIEIGRYGIWSIPKEWILEHIEELAELLLKTEDEYEYRRLFEVYEKLDKGLVHKLALRALESPNSDIRETGKDFLLDFRQ